MMLVCKMRGASVEASIEMQIMAHDSVSRMKLLQGLSRLLAHDVGPCSKRSFRSLLQSMTPLAKSLKMAIADCC